MLVSQPFLCSLLETRAVFRRQLSITSCRVFLPILQRFAIIVRISKLQSKRAWALVSCLSPIAIYITRIPPQVISIGLSRRLLFVLVIPSCSSKENEWLSCTWISKGIVRLIHVFRSSCSAEQIIAVTPGQI